MSERSLRALIRYLIEAEEKPGKEGPNNLLIEPDESESNSTEESSAAAGGGGGPAMPMGVDATYPGPSRRSSARSHKEQTRVVGNAFGRARPHNI